MRDEEDGVERCGECFFPPSSSPSASRSYRPHLTDDLLRFLFFVRSLLNPVDCGYEINDGSCVNCGAVYLENDDSDGSLEADDLVGFLYGDGQDHAEDDGPGFEFGDESDEGESEEGSVLTDGFLVDDEEVLILSGSDSEEEEEGDGDELVRSFLFSRPKEVSLIPAFVS